MQMKVNCRSSQCGKDLERSSAQPAAGSKVTSACGLNSEEVAWGFVIQVLKIPKPELPEHLQVTSFTASMSSGQFFFLISFENLLFPRLLSLDLLFCTSVKRSSRQWFPHRYLKAAQRCPPSLRANRALFPQPLLMCFGALKAVITPSLPANEESLCLFGLARCPHLQMENKPPKPRGDKTPLL